MVTELPGESQQVLKGEMATLIAGVCWWGEGAFPLTG